MIVAGLFPSESLDLLTSGTKWNLEELRLSVQRRTSEFPELLRKLLEESVVLQRLELLCSKDADLGEDLEDIEHYVRFKNWDLKFLYHVQKRYGRN